MQNIPKIIHYCWFGRGEKNQKIKEYMESWKKYLPDYEVIEWNEDNFDINCNQYVKEAYENRKWAFVTDYVRLYVLYHYGGIYMDTDVEVLKPLDVFLENQAFSGFEDEIHISTGIIGSVKGHNWIKFLLDDYKKRHFIKPNGEFDYTTNVVRITTLSKKFFNFDPQKNYQILKDDVVIYPKDYFCPKSCKNFEINLTKNTYTIHHFNGSWFETQEEKRKRKLKRRIKRYSKIFVIILAIMIIGYFIKS